MFTSTVLLKAVVIDRKERYLQEVVRSELVDRGNPAVALLDFDDDFTVKGKTK